MKFYDGKIGREIQGFFGSPYWARADTMETMGKDPEEVKEYFDKNDCKMTDPGNLHPQFWPLFGIIRCNCEAQSCTDAGGHWPGACYTMADPHLRVQDLGALCPACYQHYPEEYRIKFCSQCGELAKGGPNCNGDDCHEYPASEYGRRLCSTCDDQGFQAFDCPDCGR